MSAATDVEKPTTTKSMTGKILAGIGLGIVVGLFFGEPAGHLGVIGDVYVGLLQMTVLPFIVASLISNIGRFRLREGRRLFLVSLLVLLLLSALAMVSLVILPLAFPPLEAGAFFNESMVELGSSPDFYELYVPSNPFRALSESLVPAVVLFCILVGIALAGIERKSELLAVLDSLLKAFARVNSFVVRQTPIGVFAIAASAAGTLSLDEFGRLQAYFLTHTIGVLLMVFVVLPRTISTLTPLRYGAILSASRDFLITALATGSLFAVLPMLVTAIQRLLRDQDWASADSQVQPSALVSLGYPLPTAGKILALIFVPFVAWFIGRPLEAEQYPLFMSAGLLSSFGSLNLTIPFLLDLLQLPADFFSLFLMAGVWSARFGDMAGGMHLLAFTVLTMAGLSGRLRIHPRRLFRLVVILVLLTVAAVVGMRMLLTQTFVGRHTRAEELAKLDFVDNPVETTVLTESAPNPTPLAPGEGRLERVRRRGILRAGYSASRFPFSFRNDSGSIVGHDIAVVSRLALDLDAELEFVPFQASTLAAQLADDHFDLAIGSVWGTPGLAGEIMVSEPYLETHGALLVRDHRRKELDTIDALRALETDLTLGIATGSHLRDIAARVAPEAHLVFLETEQEFFDSDEIDALVTTAEGGSAWTLAYPGYDVVFPVQPAPRIPLVMPVAGHDRALRDFLDTWIGFREGDGSFAEFFAHWIEGKVPEAELPRWSIGRDVLGWWR